ncbi:homoserine acetyltransferase family protein [Halenospora varia]|nr:homoserine acetyltransferase family protein [Halenospora varia]
MPSNNPYDSTGVEHYPIKDFKFSDGTVKDIQVAYRSINPEGKKTALLPTCFGGLINDTLNFKDSALKGYHVIVVAMLGNGESTSPSNDPSFPPNYTLRYEDQINAQHTLLTQHLKLQSLDVVIGFSMGGQQVYYWAVMHSSPASPNPNFLKNAVVICSSARTSGHNYAFLEGPISALETSHDYDGGKYREKGIKPRQGLRAFGRAYAAWLTSSAWFRLELWRQLGAPSVQAWLHPPGESSAEKWDAEDYLVLARCWQAADVGLVNPGGKSEWRDALKEVEARVLVMPCRTDQYFAWEDGEEECKFLKHSRLEIIPSIWGHIAGGGANEEDTLWTSEKIADLLKE